MRPDDTGVFGNDVHFREKLPDVVTLPQHFQEQRLLHREPRQSVSPRRDVEDVQAGDATTPPSWDDARYLPPPQSANTGEGRNLTGGKLTWCRWLAAEGGDEDQPDGQIARDAVRLLEEQHRDRPFFLAVGFHKPHDPFVAPKKYFDLYPLDEMLAARRPARPITGAAAGDRRSVRTPSVRRSSPTRINASSSAPTAPARRSSTPRSAGCSTRSTACDSATGRSSSSSATTATTSASAGGGTRIRFSNTPPVPRSSSPPPV